MARKKPDPKAEFVLFDVIYTDGSQRSNRRVPSAALDGPDGDAAAWNILQAQDREIGEMSGQPRPPIKSVTRSRVR